MLATQKIVAPVKTGVQSFSNEPKTLDSAPRALIRDLPE